MRHPPHLELVREFDRPFRRWNITYMEYIPREFSTEKLVIGSTSPFSFQ
jgi:hypothetical protein